MKTLTTAEDSACAVHAARPHQSLSPSKLPGEESSSSPSVSRYIRLAHNLGSNNDQADRRTAKPEEEVGCSLPPQPVSRNFGKRLGLEACPVQSESRVSPPSVSHLSRAEALDKYSADHGLVPAQTAISKNVLDTHPYRLEPRRGAEQLFAVPRKGSEFPYLALHRVCPGTQIRAASPLLNSTHRLSTFGSLNDHCVPTPGISAYNRWSWKASSRGTQRWPKKHFSQERFSCWHRCFRSGNLVVKNEQSKVDEKLSKLPILKTVTFRRQFTFFRNADFPGRK